MKNFARLLLVATTCAATAAVLPGRVAAQTPAPSYFTTTPDAVTGDNAPVSWSGRINGVRCTASAPCYLPDAGADSYLSDVYERPTGVGSGSQSDRYYQQIDIVSSSVGYDSTFLYYRFTLYGGPLDQKYGFEINFDGDVSGDLFVEVDDPADKTPGSWASSHVTAYLDSDNSVGGANPLLPDGPGNINGYENKVYNTGNNQYAGKPGGDNALRARANGNILELAVERAFLDAVNGGTEVTKAAFRPLASRIPFNEGDYYIHDDAHRQKVGSAYPWLSQAGAPAACPTSSDAALTQAEIDALESGVPTPTAFINPCFPAFQVQELDIGGSVADFSVPTLQFEADMAIQKTAGMDSVSIGDTLVYSITASNVTAGAGVVTAVVVTDTLPTAVALVSAVPTAGTCSGTTILTCSLGDIQNGQSESVTVTVTGQSVASTTNRAWVDQNESDTDLTNQFDAASVEVFQGTPLILVSGTDTLPRVPSNGVSYPYAFAVSHTYTASKTILLSAVTANGATVLAIDSITGPAVVSGATPDSASLPNRPRGLTDSVTVWVDVANVPAGAADSVYLEGVVVQAPASDVGTVHYVVVRPALTTGKTVNVSGPVGPGVDITYTIDVANGGEASAVDVVVVDSLPPQVYYKVGSTAETLPSGVTATAEFSDDDGATWTYIPTSGGCGAPAGYDGCATNIRWTVIGVIPGTGSGSGNTGAFSFESRVR